MEKTIYENDKCIITKDSLQYIVREKPINKKRPYDKATYILNKDNILWKLCDQRKLFSPVSDTAMAILRAVKGISGPVGILN